MAFLEESSQKIKSEYPDLYNLVLDKMTSKNVDPNSIKWGYDYCVLLDNSKSPESLSEAIDDVKRRYGISVTACSGRKHVSELVKRASELGDIPSAFIMFAMKIILKMKVIYYGVEL